MKHTVAPMRPTPDSVDVGQLCHALSVSVQGIEIFSRFVQDNFSIDHPGLYDIVSALDAVTSNPVIAEMLGNTSLDGGDTHHTISLPIVELTENDTALHEDIRAGNLNDDTELDKAIGY